MESSKPRPKPKPRNLPKNEDVQNVSNEQKDQIKGANLVSSLIEHNKILDDKLSQIKEEELKKEERLSDLNKTLAILQLKSKEVENELCGLEEKERLDEDDRTSENIQRLLVTYERLKSDEKQFKEMCHSELERLQELAAQAEESDSPQGEIESQLERSRGRVEAGRAELATVTRKLATLKRQTEQVPNRIELREYRLRFAELYNQVSATHRETKQFYSLYNTLEDTKRNLEKELSLLNSIVDSYQLACQTASGREEFFRQLSSLYEGMKETCLKVDKHFVAEKQSVEKLEAELAVLRDLKVAYEKGLQELERECRVNDQLFAECKKLDAGRK